MGFSLSGRHLGNGRFPFRGTLGQWVFPFQGDTWAMGVSLSGGHLGSGFFPFRGTLGQWAGLRGGKALGVTKPAFPPRAPPFRARRCSALWYATMYWQMPVCCCIGHVQLCRWMCGNVTPNSSYLPYPREQARCAGRFPVRRNKKIGSA